jgi:threonine dehydrogenase-like Zn-dependent dehydrogenase
MKAVVFRDGSAITVDRPEPRATGDIVTVRILVSPMCTEFKGRQSDADILGHEAAGIVVDAANSTRVGVGDRVVVMPQYGCGTCWLCAAGDHIHCPNQRDVLAETQSEYGTATYAEIILKPDYLLLPVPDDISLRHAALACCGLGPSFTAMSRMDVGGLDTVLVSGCGPVGLGAVINATARGARVIALEPTAFRRKLAERLGAAITVDPTEPDAIEQIRELTAGRGADCAVETSGAPGAPALLARATRVRGRIAIVAWGNEVTFPPLVPLGQEIHGCWHWNHQRYAEAMWRTLRSAQSTVDDMVTHELPLEQADRAMDLQDSGECGKVYLLPGGAEGWR